MNSIIDRTLSDIVRENYQAAIVFRKYGLDFCCKGKRPLKEACEEKSIPEGKILEELDQALSSQSTETDYNAMTMTELVEYIVRVHHTYVKTNIPQILHYLLKVASKHGDRFPYMKQAYKLFTHLAEEMEEHMKKEELILFPRIKLMELHVSEKGRDYIRVPVEVMEHEHDVAGSLIAQIREVTNNFLAPSDACTTFRVALASLQAFEADLHHHVHLENNILFPKALQYFENNLN